MDLFVVVCIAVTLTFLPRVLIYCINFYLKRKHSVSISISKCGFTSFKGIVVKYPYHIDGPCLRIDHLKIASNYLDNSCPGPFLLHISNASFQIPINKDAFVSVNAQSLDVDAKVSGPKTVRFKGLGVQFEQESIATCNTGSITHNPAPEAAVILDREQNSCGIKLSNKQNSLLCVEADKVQFTFPYKYDFSHAFNEQVLGFVKWLKKFRMQNKKPDSAASGARIPLAVGMDMSFKINKLLFDICDDPFETRLRNNYMLLQDEYNEQIKREQTLQEKLNELKQTNLMMASSSIDELNRVLAKKNSDIYIQRSKQLYSFETKQIPLLRVMIEDADLKILADSSFHDHQDIRAIIKRLNPDASLTPDIHFSTLWCRIISATFKSVDVTLRDYPITMLSISEFTVKGQVVGTEQVAVARARRSCKVYVGQNMSDQYVERSMTPMKFFHNLQLRCTSANYTHGPCWEPILQQVSISFEDIVSASSDPSPALPWWDKFRFLFHGQAKLNCNQLSIVLHASNDPYNHTELIELSLSRSSINWQGDKINAKGDFDVLLHTASKYDECRFLHIPKIDLVIEFVWNCVGNPNDHFSIMPCAPDKVPDYSSHHSHDSYRSFRSQSINLNLTIETQFTSPSYTMNPDSMPSMLFFGSTIRWLENQKIIFVGPSRLTRRGKLFNNTKPKKPSLTRTFKDIKLKIRLNRFQILYWSSVSKRHGIHMLGGELSHQSEHSLHINANNNSPDGLIHRPESNWQCVYMNSSLNNGQLWLYNLSFEDLDEFNEFNVQTNLKNRQYFMSFGAINYNKDNPMDVQAKTMMMHMMMDDGSISSLKSQDMMHASEDSQRDDLDGHSAATADMNESLGGGAATVESPDGQHELAPNHKLEVRDLKAAWTKDNRDVVVGIFDAFINSQQLKRNLSTEALKPLRVDHHHHNQGQHPHAHPHLHQTASSTSASSVLQSQTSLASNSSPPYRHQRHPSTTSLMMANIMMMGNSMGSNPSSQASVSSVSKNRAVSMLQKLIADSENNPNVYTEESHSGVQTETHLYGVEACDMDDVVEVNCLIEFINSQVVLCGTETPGYMIVSAANTEVRQATHLPVWKNRTLLSKTSWTGSLKCMQYYATVDGGQAATGLGDPAGTSSQTASATITRRVFTNESDIQWLDADNIDHQHRSTATPSTATMNSSRGSNPGSLDLMRTPSGSVGGVVSSIVGRSSMTSSTSSSNSPSLSSFRFHPLGGHLQLHAHNQQHQQHQVAPEPPELVEVQLQRIISRCNCMFYYAAHHIGVSDHLQHLIPPLPDDDLFIEPWDKEVGVDTFTLTHQDLEISTNSQQYAMIMDIVNNLLLFVEPHKKSAFEKLERMRFTFQLGLDEDQRGPISELQHKIRDNLAYLKQLERQRYLIYRASLEDSVLTGGAGAGRGSYRAELDSLSCEIQTIKEELNVASEELAIMISCYKELQLGTHKAQKQQQQAASQGGTGAIFANVIKRNEICFKNASWKVTDSDGQLGLADIVLHNFLYSKVVKSDDSVEHTIELGHLHVSNLIPNQAYKNVLHPTELQANIPVDRQRALRVFCRELAPVGGIPVKEHLEVNVVPFTIELTLQFFQKMVKFFFPDKDKEKDHHNNHQGSGSATNGAHSKDEAKSEASSSGHSTGMFGTKRRNKDKDKDKDKHKDKDNNSERTTTQAMDHINRDRVSSYDSVSLTTTMSARSSLALNGAAANAMRHSADDQMTLASAQTLASSGGQSTVSSLNSNQQLRRGDDIEKMRERASKNHTFVYVKIPGIPIKVSYKGKKQKNVTDLKNISLTLPTYEYHNYTWTWLDLLMAVKNDSKHTVIKQALKQKMKIRPSIWSKSSNSSNNNAVSNASGNQEQSPSSGESRLPVTDEEKARLLLGPYATLSRVVAASSDQARDHP